MTQGTLDLPADAAAPRPRWAEFLLTGGATLFFFPLSWLLRRGLGLDSAEYAAGFVTFYAAWVINDPHFTVTYFLFYRDVKNRALCSTVPLAQRARYLFAGFFFPVLLVGWALGALTSRSAATLGGMVQLMFVLVGWHYVKQGFGVLSVLSARRGIRLSTWERRAILFHCYAGWGYAWASPAIPRGWYEERGVVYEGVAHPRALEVAAAAVLAASVVAVVFVLVQKWRRERVLIPLAPLTGLLVSVWLWSIYSAVDPVVRYFIPALHSIQYLYFVWIMRRNLAREQRGEFGASVAKRLALLAALSLGLSWLLFHGAPAIADGAIARSQRGLAVGLMGVTPATAAFYTFVNLHHYAMDMVIWRRDNPDTRYLRETALA